METPDFEREFMLAMRRFGKINMGQLLDGFSHGEFSAMMALKVYSGRHNGKGASASVLAELAESSPQAMSRTLRSLEAKGCIERQPDIRDRRNTCIHLTPHAESVLDVGRERLSSLLRQVVQEMGEEDITLLITLLNRVVDIVQSLLGDYGNGVGNQACTGRADSSMD